MTMRAKWKRAKSKAKRQAVDRSLHPVVLRLELTPSEASELWMALIDHKWTLYSRFEAMEQKGFRFRNGKEPTKAEIDEMYARYKSAESLSDRIAEIKYTQNTAIAERG